MCDLGGPSCTCKHKFYVSIGAFLPAHFQAYTHTCSCRIHRTFFAAARWSAEQFFVCGQGTLDIISRRGTMPNSADGICKNKPNQPEILYTTTEVDSLISPYRTIISLCWGLYNLAKIVHTSVHCLCNLFQNGQ